MAKGKYYSISEKSTRMLNTTQSNIVIPTDGLIKKKGTDFRVFACVSAISNVDNFMQIGDNDRYCSLKKLNHNLNSVAELTGMSRAKVMSKIRDLESHKLDEFKVNKRECDGVKMPCIEIHYKSGGFVTMEYEFMEKLASSLSNNAFKLYINLLWLCRDNKTNKFITRQLNQEYLAELIGLSRNSTKSLRKAEQELLQHELIKIEVIWEKQLNDDLTLSNPITKKFYKVIDV